MVDVAVFTMADGCGGLDAVVLQWYVDCCGQVYFVASFDSASFSHLQLHLCHRGWLVTLNW